ncbi:MAG: hypothetical protein AMXMBFR81_24520 [Chthonomonas sp.]
MGAPKTMKDFRFRPDPQHILRIFQQAVEFELEDIREGRPLPFPYGRWIERREPGFVPVTVESVTYCLKMAAEDARREAEEWEADRERRERREAAVQALRDEYERSLREQTGA